MLVKMFPHISELGNGESGIHTVIRKYFQHLPKFGIELVPPDTDTYDLRAAHAGITGSDCEVCHTHGLYWTADYNASDWEWHVNSRVIEAIRGAKEVTCPSEWVNEVFKRDYRKSVHVIPHGVDWEEWQHTEENRGYVLWNKNRNNSDAVDNSVLDILFNKFPDVQFVSTLPTQQTQGFINSPMWPKNFRVLPNGSRTPHEEMKGFIQRSGVYLSTSKETFGLSILESMASGKPILGWNWGGNTQLVQHGVNGYLAKPNDIDDLCEGLNYCLKYAKRLGSNGRELAKQWTWVKSCELVAGVYRLAMNEDDRPMKIPVELYQRDMSGIRELHPTSV